jgi:hypothetical protein
VRRFLLLVPALAALVTLHPTPAAAAGATLPCWLAKPPVLPEPQPIQVDQATIDRATAMLNAIAQGTFDQSQLAPELQTANTAAFFGRGAVIVSALGPVQAMFPFEQRITAEKTSTYFRVQFPKETLTWVMSIDPQGKIAGLSLRRKASCLIFNIIYKSDVPY